MVVDQDPAKHYPIVALDKLPEDRDPTHTEILHLEKQLKSCLATTHTTAGGGAHGHIGMIENATVYLALAGEAWVDPPAPPPFPNVDAYMPSPTQYQLIQANLEHKMIDDAFQQKRICNNQGVKLLTAAVPEHYYKGDQDDPNATITTMMQILTPLQVYKEVTNKQLEDNEDDLIAPWNTTDPLSKILVRFNRCKSFARDHRPLSQQTITGKFLRVVTESEAFPRDVRDWNERTAPAGETETQKWKAIVAHFNKAEKYRKLTSNTKDKGYSANKIEKKDGENKENETYWPGTRDKNSDSGKHLPRFYCWTHGLCYTHSSKNCNKPDEGHEKTATLDDMMMGNYTIWRRKDEAKDRGDKPRFKPKRRVRTTVDNP